MKRAISFSVCIGLFIVLSAMSSYLQLGQYNYSGSASNGQTCSVCHGNNDTSLSITYWQPDSTCYNAGSTYDFGIHVRDTSILATFAGVQVSTVNLGLNGSPDPVTLGILGSGNGFFRATTINGIEIHTTETPNWLGWGITYPSQTQGYGTNIFRRYWTASSATDTIFHYISVVMTDVDSSMFNDRVISSVLKIPACPTPLGLGTRNYDFEGNPVDNSWELWANDFTILGQNAAEGSSPFEVFRHKYNHSTKKVVKVY